MLVAWVSCQCGYVGIDVSRLFELSTNDSRGRLLGREGFCGHPPLEPPAGALCRPGWQGGRCVIYVGSLGCFGFGIGAFEKCIVVCRGMCWESFCYYEGLPRGVDKCRDGVGSLGSFL